MNNKEYIYELSQRCGYTQENTQKYVRSVIEVMASRFDEGENVSVPNFGTFELKNRMERIVVNPSTGQRMMVFCSCCEIRTFSKGSRRLCRADV